MITNLLLSPEPSRFDDSCLFLSQYRLERAFCPFQVTCIEAVRKISKGEKKQVDKVLSWGSGLILYFINGKLYPHHFFRYNPPTHFVLTSLDH